MGDTIDDLARINDDLKQIQMQLITKTRKRNSTLIQILHVLGLFDIKHLDDEIIKLMNEQKRLFGTLTNELSQIEIVINEVEKIKTSSELIQNDRIQRLMLMISTCQVSLDHLIQSAGINTSELKQKKELLMTGLHVLEVHNKQIEEKQRKLEFLTKSLDFEKRIDVLFKKETYLIFPQEQQLITELNNIQKSLSCVEDINFVSEKENLLAIYRNRILSYNLDFINSRKKQYSYLFNKGKEYSLDEEQKEAIIKDDLFNLVVAGAGSGKTETLITRIRYLVERKPDTINQEKILALAYTNAAKDEIIERLKNHGIMNVEVKTFHKLGNAILEGANKKLRPAGENKPIQWVLEIINSKKDSDPTFRKAFLNYVKSFSDDKTITESKKTHRPNNRKNGNYYAINDLRVRSRAEKAILDFFLTNKLNDAELRIEYEPIINARLNYSDGRHVDNFEPDIRLSDYDLIIEHFALDEQGNAPQKIKGTSQEWSEDQITKYRENMNLKKKWFADNNKLVVYTYGNEYNPNFTDDFIEILKGRILSTLKERYNQNFEFNPMLYDEVIKVVFGLYDDPIPNNIMSFITNAKVYGQSPEDIQSRLNNNEWSQKQIAFADLALIVFRDYQRKLVENERNDFEDMINKPIEELKQDNTLFKNKYDHILIDEYQDISKQRFDLIRELLWRNDNCKLFCVGDDWQSIMGFAGSDLDYFVNFEKYCPIKSCETKIQTNYRSIKSIVETGNAIINNNTYKRTKITRARKIEQRKIEIDIFNNDTMHQYLIQSVQKCVLRIRYMLGQGYSPSDFMILSRIRQPMLRLFQDEFRRQTDNSASIKISTNGVSKDAIRILTVHGSKGLQSRVVIIMNVIDDLFGFPCMIQNPIILEPAKLKRLEYDPIEEERRLFYVAITRAMEDVIIYTHKDYRSQFLDEIKEFSIEMPIFNDAESKPLKQYEGRRISSKTRSDLTYT